MPETTPKFLKTEFQKSCNTLRQWLSRQETSST